jgi:hypothetical protein
MVAFYMRGDFPTLLIGIDRALKSLKAHGICGSKPRLKNRKGNSYGE